MAAPNLISPTAIYGKTATVKLTTTSATSIVNNSASSNKVLKINALYAVNVNGVTNAELTINLYSAASLGGTATPICSTITVPADASIVVIEKNAYIYLEEDRSIGAIASTANDINIVCSYEEIG